MHAKSKAESWKERGMRCKGFSWTRDKKSNVCAIHLSVVVGVMAMMRPYACGSVPLIGSTRMSSAFLSSSLPLPNTQLLPKYLCSCAGHGKSERYTVMACGIAMRLCASASLLVPSLRAVSMTSLQGFSLS